MMLHRADSFMFTQDFQQQLIIFKWIRALKSCKYWMTMKKLSNKMTTFGGCTSLSYVSSWKPPGVWEARKALWFVESRNNKCLSPTQSRSSSLILSSHREIVFCQETLLSSCQGREAMLWKFLLTSVANFQFSGLKQQNIVLSCSA